MLWRSWQEECLTGNQWQIKLALTGCLCEGGFLYVREAEEREHISCLGGARQRP